MKRVLSILLLTVGCAHINLEPRLPMSAVEQSTHHLERRIAMARTNRVEFCVRCLKSPVPNVRAIGHFIGLQMALKQLENPLITVETP